MSHHRSKTVILRCSASLIVMATALGASSAFAQDAAAAKPDVAEVGEVVVTAQKRSERLVEVPIAVSAVSADALEKAQINDTASLSKAVPSLSFQQGNNPNNSTFRVRGVGAQLFGQAVEPAVSVVVDGVVGARSAQGFADLADIERIEVLRGPQGTLFGKNATAGVLNIVTLKPDDYFNGKVDATIAEDNEYRIKGTVTGPIAEGLNGRVSGFYNHVGGFIRNVATGKDTNGFESWGVRGKLELDKGGPFTALLTAEVREIDANCCSRVPVKVVTPAIQTLLGSIVASPDNRQVSNDDASYSFSQLASVSLQTDYDLGQATITSISAYQHWKSKDQFEPDQIVSNPVRYVGNFGYAQWNANASSTAYDAWSEELRIASNGSTPLTYVAGVYLAGLDMDRGLDRRQVRCASGVIGQTCTGAQTGLSSGFRGNFKSKSSAIFGQADYNLVAGLHVLGGLRVSYEKQIVTGNRYVPVVAGDLPFAGLTNDSGTSTRDDTAVTGKAGLRYEFNRNTNMYASYTRGYKAFALDIDAGTTFSDNKGLNPEHVDAYEIGLKTRTLDGKLDVNIAVFRTDFANLQVQAIDQTNGNFQVRLLNAGQSRSQGFEIESTWRPVSGLSIPVGFTYLDATIDVNGQTCAFQQQAAAQTFAANYPVNTCYKRQTTSGGVTTTSSPIIDVKGGKLPLAPRYRVNLAPRYDFDLNADWRAFVQANINYQSRQIFQINQDPLLEQKGYTQVDLSVGVSTGKISLTAFAKNVFDKTYYSQLNHGTILTAAATPYDLWANIPKDADRYFGATLGYRF
jgi:iron complex outermembrane receptor protein